MLPEDILSYSVLCSLQHLIYLRIIKGNIFSGVSWLTCKTPIESLFSEYQICALSISGERCQLDKLKQLLFQVAAFRDVLQMPCAFTGTRCHRWETSCASFFHPIKSHHALLIMHHPYDSLHTHCLCFSNESSSL